MPGSANQLTLSIICQFSARSSLRGLEAICKFSNMSYKPPEDNNGKNSHKSHTQTLFVCAIKENPTIVVSLTNQMHNCIKESK